MLYITMIHNAQPERWHPYHAKIAWHRLSAWSQNTQSVYPGLTHRYNIVWWNVGRSKNDVHV